jgi:hypothetical protein
VRARFSVPHCAFFRTREARYPYPRQRGPLLTARDDCKNLANSGPLIVSDYFLPAGPARLGLARTRANVSKASPKWIEEKRMPLAERNSERDAKHHCTAKQCLRGRPTLTRRLERKRDQNASPRDQIRSQRASLPASLGRLFHRHRRGTRYVPLRHRGAAACTKAQPGLPPRKACARHTPLTKFPRGREIVQAFLAHGTHTKVAEMVFIKMEVRRFEQREFEG